MLRKYFIMGHMKVVITGSLVETFWLRHVYTDDGPFGLFPVSKINRGSVLSSPQKTWNSLDDMADNACFVLF